MNRISQKGKLEQIAYKELLLGLKCAKLKLPPFLVQNVLKFTNAIIILTIQHDIVG